MKKGFSIIELLVVMVIIAMLIGLAIPAIKAMQKSFGFTGAEGMISAALATARTLAISNGRYAGVRFQTAGDPNNVLKADQYMIFIIYDSNGETGTVGWVCGFVAIEGYKPIKLPQNVGVEDETVRIKHGPAAAQCDDVNERQLTAADLSDDVNIADISTFSMVFSPAGKLVSHGLRCGQRRNDSNDIFNTINNVCSNPPKGMFVEDNHDDFGVGAEMSRREFVIYDRSKFEKMTTGSQRRNYLNGLNTLYVNPYTGEIIK